MKSVLVVDDGVFMRTLIKGMLTKQGYSIIGEADRGDVAVQMYQELKPDIVTMDINMPVKDGIYALEEILKIDEDAKVIMVSSLGQEEYIKKAILLGAKGFVVKPFDEESFLSILEGV